MNDKRNTITFTILVIISSILALDTVLTTSINDLTIGDMGIIYRLPVTFWIGAVLIAPILYLGRKSKRKPVAGLVLTIIYLYIVPAIIRNPVWLSNSYYPFSESLIIISEGFLIKSSEKIITSYQDWPIFLFFSSAFLLITKMPNELVLKIFPLFFISFYSLIIFQILRIKLDFFSSILGTIWFLGSFWVRQYYFGPPGFSCVYFFLIILIVLMAYHQLEDVPQNLEEKRLLTILAILIYLSLTATHLLTSFFALLLMVSLYMVQRRLRGVADTNIKLLIFLFSVVFVSYNTLSVQNILVKIIYREVFLSEPFRIYQESGRILGSRAMLLNYFSSWIIVILNGVAAALSLLKILREKKVDLIHLFFIVFLILGGIFAIGGRYGSHEAYQRAFMFGLVPLSFFAVDLLKEKKTLMIFSVISLIILNFPAQYGSDSFRLAIKPQLEGSKFFSEAIPEESHVLTKFTLYIRYFEPEKDLIIVRYGDFPFTSKVITSELEKSLNVSEYYAPSVLLENFYLFYLDENPLNNIDHHPYDRLYDNYEYKIFKTHKK